MSWWKNTTTLGEIRGCRKDSTFLTLLQKRYDKFSQNGEDGIVQALFEMCHINSGWLCEFGAWDGKHLSNTRNLINSGNYNAVLIEGDSSRFQDLLRTCEENPGKVIPVNCYVGDGCKEENSLDRILSSTPIPVDFELLSIDIDSHDFLVWKSLERYRPKIVIIEINSGIDPKREDSYFGSLTYTEGGTSYLPMLRLGSEKGYTFLCHTGNMIFIRNDLLEMLEYVPHEDDFDPFMTYWWK